MESIQHLVRTKFYEICTKHGRSETCFCKDCLSTPFCETCLYNSEHRNHKVLQKVFKASRKEVVRIKDINKFWNVSDVQPFVCNSQTVVYIRERMVKGNPMCTICEGRKLEDKYAFCSIECQFTSLQIEANRRTSIDDSVESSSYASSSSNDEAFSRDNSPLVVRHIRKHRRKGYPVRSPFY